MKEKFILNRLSERILNTGLFICILGYLGILIRSYYISQTEILKSREISLMLEHVSMTVLIVVIFALILDIHIKHSEK